MTSRTSVKSLANAVVLTMRLLGLAMHLAVAGRFDALYADVRLTALGKRLHAVTAVVMPECTSCKEERAKKGLPPMERIKLPSGVTDSRNFRRPRVGTYVCPYCDGETLVSSAVRSFKARQDA